MAVPAPVPDADPEWLDWKWQQSNAVRDLDGLKRRFPKLGPETCARIEENGRRVRFQLTPYLLSLVTERPNGCPDPDDPIWKQHVPTYDPPKAAETLASILGDNWELPQDMVNPILQHKYDNRVIFRIQNRCLAYCSYCFEAKRVLDRHSSVDAFREELFRDSLNYISRRPDIQEVVISGGEPMLLSNEKMERVLGALRGIRHVRAIRIHTRSFVHNPFRIDDEFVRLLVRYDVTALSLHLTHPVEITAEFREVIDRLSRHGCRTLLLGQIPLLKGVNDNEATLKELFMSLYALKVKPYYFFHAMPETLGAEQFRTTVRHGAELVSRLKRRISNAAMPEYVILHSTGKHMVPLEPQGTENFQYLSGGRIRFKNWRGEWCEYLDGSDA